jgi:PAS domain S-box-containing protein
MLSAAPSLSEPSSRSHPDTPQVRSTPSLDDAFFRQIVLGMRNGVLAIDRDTRIVLINAEACRIFGLPDDEGAVGLPVATALSAHPEVARLLGSVFELHHLPNRAEVRLKGSSTVIGYTLGFVRNDQGGVIGATMFFKDLTRVEQLEERERLRDRLAAVGEMAAMIAHEVKNPLAGIEVMAGLLRRKVADTPDAQAVLTDIIREAEMANRIVQEVLDFVRPVRLHVERTDVGGAIAGAIQLADTKARRGETSVDVVIPSDLPRIHADEHQLTQVFTNLLINAYEALGGTGFVRVRASRTTLRGADRERDAVRIDISDNGPGVDADVEGKMFAPFFTTKPQGSGLGLAIVRKIVDAHDGKLDLETVRGHGTTIRVTLPVRGDDEI